MRRQDLLLVGSEMGDGLQIFSGLNQVRINIYCDKLFTHIHSGLNPVDKYDMRSEIVFLFKVYP